MNKQELFKGMKALGINLQVHYLPVYRQPFYQKNFGYKSGDYPVAEKFYDRAVSIPLYPSLTNAEIEQVVTDITKFVGSK
jgi:dTDP-4-amino-4,6-dideoxygalactose transaminase